MMNDISINILRRLYALSIQPEVNLRSSIASFSENTGYDNDAVNSSLIYLENNRYIDTFRLKHKADYQFILRLTKKGFDYEVEQGWMQRD